MGLYRIVKLSDLDESYKEQTVEVFVEGFYDVLTMSRDKAILKELFINALDFSMFYVCIHEQRVIGLIGLANSLQRPMRLQEGICLRLFGKLKGRLVYRQMRIIMESPINMGVSEGYIDYITTDAAYRGKGIATELINFICNHLNYKSYSLDVLSKNTEAKKLYEKLGFKQVKVYHNIFTLINGIGYPIKMKLQV